MKLGKSGKEECSLLVADEVHSLNGFRGMVGSLLDGDGRVVKSGLSSFIAENLGFLGVNVVLVSNRKNNAVSRSFLGCGFNLISGKAVLRIAC